MHSGVRRWRRNLIVRVIVSYLALSTFQALVQSSWSNFSKSLSSNPHTVRPSNYPQTMTVISDAELNGQGNNRYLLVIARNDLKRVANQVRLDSMPGFPTSTLNQHEINTKVAQVYPGQEIVFVVDSKEIGGSAVNDLKISVKFWSSPKSWKKIPSIEFKGNSGRNTITVTNSSSFLEPPIRIYCVAFAKSGEIVNFGLVESTDLLPMRIETLPFRYIAKPTATTWSASCYEDS